MSQTTEANAPAYVPDITKDRMLTFFGGIIRPMDSPALFVQNPAMYVTLIPSEPKDGVYPWPVENQILITAMVGTVDELTEAYRQGLTRAYNVMTAEPNTQFAKHQEFLKRSGFGPGVQLPFTCGNAAAEAFLARREKFGAARSALPAVKELALKEFVGQYGRYHECVTTNENGIRVPTDAPAAVQKLIDDLSILKAEAVARRQPKPSETPSATQQDGVPAGLPG